MAKKVSKTKAVNENLSLSKGKTISDKIIKVTAKNEEQREALKAIHENQVTFIIGKPGTGKAQPMDSTVYCPDGPVKMKDIKVGDEVCTPDGLSAKVLAIYPQGKKDIYRLTFADGSSVECCKEHLWRITERQKTDRNAKSIVNTQYLIDNIKTNLGERNIYIEISSPVLFSKKHLLIDPYILGILIGDGCIRNSNVCVSSADEEILTSVSNDLPNGYSLKKSFGKYDYRIVKTHLSKLNGSQSNIYKNSLRLYGLWGKKSYEKFIPEDYLYSSEDQRWSILQGLMDTDGYVDKKTGQAYFCTSSKELSQNVKLLVDSLAGLCTISEKNPTYTYLGKKKNGRKAYICCLNLPDCAKAFRISRKKEIAKSKTKYSPKKRILISVEKIGSKDSQCILIDSKDHLYLTDNFIVTHNTHCAVGYGLQELYRGNFERIIFARPYVEAGEKLGYLPGSFDAKTAPFMIPMYEVVRDYFGEDDIREMVDERKIVVLPFAYMRGINFKNAYVVTDEAQNATPQQMHLLLTRICDGSKVVVTGDVYQSDLKYQMNGLMDAVKKLRDIDGLGFVELTYESCVRAKIVQDIDARYRKDHPSGLSLKEIIDGPKTLDDLPDIRPHVDERGSSLYD